MHHQLKDTFVIHAVQMMLNELDSQTASSLLLTHQQETSVREALQLLTSSTLDEVTDDVLQLKLLLRRWWEHKRYQFGSKPCPDGN